MKRNNGYVKTSLSILFCFLTTSVFPQSAEINYIKVEHNVNNRVYFRIFDLNVYSMKDRYIHTAFLLSQDGEWIDGSEIILEPEYVLYDHTVWNSESYWFYYPYEEFNYYGNPAEPYWGSFLVIDSANNSLLLQQDIKFSLPEFVIETTTSKDENDSTPAKGEFTSTFSWTHSKNNFSSNFRITQDDYYRSQVERDTFQPLRGKAEDSGEYISLWDIDFNEFYSDLYGYLYQRNSNRLSQVKKELLNLKDKFSLGYSDFAEFVINCVQHTTYKLPEKTWGIYTPLEIIESKTGDCDSRSVLLYLLFRDFGYDVSIFYSDYYQHAMLGIANVGYGDYLKHGGIKYFFVETTATGWGIGDLPPDWSNKNHWVILFPLLRK
jgi:hypothetical protein